MTTLASGAPKEPPHALRYDITGCHLAAIVLERLQYWTPRTRVRREGKAWIAKSRADLMRETRLTEWQLRASLDKLRERDIVVTERRRFGGETILHLRITPRGRMALAKAGLVEGSEEPQQEENLPTEVEADLTSGVDADLNSLEQGGINKGLYTGDSTSYGGALATDFSEKVSEETKTMKEPRKPRVNPPKAPLSANSKPRNSVEVMEMLKAGKPAPKPGKPAPLSSVWQAAMVEAYPGQFHAPLTGKGPALRLDTL